MESTSHLWGESILSLFDHRLGVIVTNLSTWLYRGRPSESITLIFKSCLESYNLLGWNWWWWWWWLPKLSFLHPCAYGLRPLVTGRNWGVNSSQGSNLDTRRQFYIALFNNIHKIGACKYFWDLCECTKIMRSGRRNGKTISYSHWSANESLWNITGRSSAWIIWKSQIGCCCVDCSRYLWEDIWPVGARLFPAFRFIDFVLNHHPIPVFLHEKAYLPSFYR